MRLLFEGQLLVAALGKLPEGRPFLGHLEVIEI
jgi:hypothetical protein